MYQINKACSGCHTCELVCPVGAPYYDGSRYQIDGDKCIGCGACARACPLCAVYDTEEKGDAAPHPAVEKTCDVVVCGGGAGLVSAVKLAQQGRKVILLEKAKRVGGNTTLAHGFFPIYSKLHRENDVEDVREAAVADLSARTEGVISQELTRTAVYGCSEFMDWFLDFPGVREHYTLEKLGEKRAMGPLYGPAILGFPKRIENTQSRDPSIGPGWMGTLVINTMVRAIGEQGLDVEILTGTAARHLLVDGAGAVAGVEAEDGGGRLTIRAKAVILATGGYGGSDEKLQKYFGFFDEERPVTRFSVFSNTGDAMDMLEELGVAPDPERMFVSTFGPAHHPFSYALYRLLDHPATLSVNLNGRRWFNEQLGLMNGAAHIKGSPKQVAWGIYSQKNIDDIMAEYLSDPTLSDEYHCYEGYQDDLEREAAYIKPPVVRADTLEKLAAKIGCDPGALVQTVKDYNRYCWSGRDEEFGKPAALLRPREEGPWYGVYGQLFSECAAGGVMVNGKCQVLRSDGSPIPGLYAEGDCTGAMHRRGKLAVISELTWAMASSYRAAVEVEKYI